MNVSMWVKAIQIIPRMSKEEWKKLDVVAKWLVMTRFAVMIMTFNSAAVAGILAWKDGEFNFLLWLLVAVGLIMAHATNNMLNDVTDYRRGVDTDNYYRSQYGPQPLEHGLMTMREVLAYAGVTGAIALACGIGLVYVRGPLALALLAAGAFFVLFYTWPLKYIGLGELAVLLVWGPLMVGGGYYCVTGAWSWPVVLASIPYALGPVTVIFGKHIDKRKDDMAKGIHTLPVIIGEKPARYTMLALIALEYLLVFYMILIGFFSPAMLVVVLAVAVLPPLLPMFRAPKPDARPESFPADVWPLWFSAACFVHTRRYGILFLVGLLIDAALKVAGIWH
jgi:1,4-dihydroxy-2-naphthoate octaprenyltransferase